MTFTPKVFTSGSALAALSLNEMDANDDHVREETAYRLVVSLAQITEVWVGGTGFVGFRLLLDGATYLGTPVYGTGSKKIADIGLGGVSVGLHYIRLALCRSATDGGAVLENLAMPGIVRFYRTADLQYLSVWWNYVSFSASVVTVRDITVLGHREVKGW